jgi:hypothetical protein
MTLTVLSWVLRAAMMARVPKNIPRIASWHYKTRHTRFFRTFIAAILSPGIMCGCDQTPNLYFQDEFFDRISTESCRAGRPTETNSLAIGLIP